MADGLVQTIVAASASGIGALFTAVHSATKQYKTLKNAVEDLEKKYADTVLNSVILTWKQNLETEIRAKLAELVTERFDGIRRGFRLEMDNHKDDIDRKIRDIDRMPTMPGITTLEDLKRRCDSLEDDLDRVQTELKHFVEDQGKQWNVMNRDLGQILGMLKTGSVPPRK